VARLSPLDPTDRRPKLIASVQSARQGTTRHRPATHQGEGSVTTSSVNSSDDTYVDTSTLLLLIGARLERAELIWDNCRRVGLCAVLVVGPSRRWRLRLAAGSPLWHGDARPSSLPRRRAHDRQSPRT
jgi:hypothetical protein